MKQGTTIITVTSSGVIVKSAHDPGKSPTVQEMARSVYERKYHSRVTSRRYQSSQRPSTLTVLGHHVNSATADEAEADSW
jgi:hypothetical protein